MSSRVKRKPAPAFPYSPRYPHPDPEDPFAPLKVLRDRAQSSHALRGMPSYDSSLYSSQPYLLSPSPDIPGSPFDLTYNPHPPEYYDHPPPSRPWNDSRSNGYNSDSSARLARPPRPRARPRRDSKMYFADVDLPSQPTEQQYHYRRRSQSVFVLPRTDPVLAQSPAPPALVEAELKSPPPPPPSAPPENQYTYDDRQSHGYIYGEGGADLELQVLSHMHSASSMNTRAPAANPANAHPQSLHSVPTPPMTPDDSLSLSSTSLRERSTSHSPRPALRNVVPASADTGPPTEQESTQAEAETEAETPSNIHSADFPILAPLPAADAESAPSPPARRGRTPSAARRESLPLRLRKTSFNIPPAPVRARTESAAPRVVVHKPSAAAAGESSGVGRLTRFVLPRAQKSLSHMSLGLTPLPNVSGSSAAPSANASTSTLAAPAADRREEGQRTERENAPRRAASVPALHPAGDPGLLRPAAQMRQSLFVRPPAPVVAPREEPAPEPEDDEDGQSQSGDEDAQAFTAQTTFIRPLSPSFSSTAVSSARTAEFPILHPPPPSPPPAHTNRPLSEPPPPAPLPLPLPLCPPNQYSDCPTPLPLPPIPREPDPDPEPLFPLEDFPPARTDSETPVLLAPPRERQKEKDLGADDKEKRRESLAGYLPVAQLRPLSQVRVEPQQAQAQPLNVGRARQSAALGHPLMQPLPEGRVQPVQPDVRSQLQPVVPPQTQRSDARSRTPPVQAPFRSHTPPVQLPYRAHSPEVQVPRSHVQPEQAPHRTHTPPVQAPRVHAQPERAPRRTHTPPVQVSYRSHTPPVQVAHRSDTPPVQEPRRSHSPPAEVPYRSQSPPPEAQYRSRSPVPPAPFRSQPQPPARAQSPPPQPPARAQSPPPAQPQFHAPPPQVQAPPRAHTDPGRAVSDVHNPPLSHGHAGSRNQRGERPLRTGAMAHSAQGSTRRHNTAPSTPVPHTASTMTLSPAPTAYSHAYPPSRTTAPTSVSSHSQPWAAARGRRNGGRLTAFPVPKFDEYAMPTREQLSQAASLYVVAQNGLRVQFGELFRERKLIVCFIRHFWCAMCQDYMYAVSRKVDPEVLKLAGIDLVFIGVGSSAMIKSYRQIFRTPFAMYTDPTLRLHTALGMTRRTTDAGPETERGGYVRHGTIGGIAMVVRNALRVGMPVWEKGGDVAQLGGEFVFGPGLACAYSHRMAYTRSHAPVVDVLAAAGIRTVITSPGEGGPSVLYPDDGEIWMNARRGSVSRIQTKHEKREGGEHWSPDEQCNMPYLSDTGSVVGCWGSSVSKVESNQSPRDNVPREYSELRRDYSLPSETRKEYSEPPRGCRVKKPRRSFVVANPDQSHRDDLPPTPVEEEVGYDERGWESDGAASLAYLEESQAGRTPQMQYWLKQDSLSHSFGRT